MAEGGQTDEFQLPNRRRSRLGERLIEAKRCGATQNLGPAARERRYRLQRAAGSVVLAATTLAPKNRRLLAPVPPKGCDILEERMNPCGILSAPSNQARPENGREQKHQKSERGRDQ